MLRAAVRFDVSRMFPARRDRNALRSASRVSIVSSAGRNAAAHMVTTADVTATDGHLPSIPQIKAVAIVGLKSAPCYPCGACRQVLREFNCERVIVSVNGKPRSHDFAEILPHSFGPESL